PPPAQQDATDLLSDWQCRQRQRSFPAFSPCPQRSRRPTFSERQLIPEVVTPLPARCSAHTTCLPFPLGPNTAIHSLAFGRSCAVPARSSVLPSNVRPSRAGPNAAVVFSSGRRNPRLPFIF